MRKLRKRSWFWAVALGCFVLIALLLLQRNSLQARAKRIEKGMSKEQAVAIMGCQPWFDEHVPTHFSPEDECCAWSNGYANVVVLLQNNHVAKINQPDNVFQWPAFRA